MKNSMIEGVILLNKPVDATSFDCIRHLKKLLPRKTEVGRLKIGHAGTLDPFATGLLIICIGRAATRHIKDFMGMPKKYTATAKIGQVTDSLDNTGTLIETESLPLPTTAVLQSAIASFGGGYEQTPPAYSALKFNGKPLYELARKGKISDEQMAKITTAKKRDVTLYDCKLDEHDDDSFTVTATVSQGTYIRTLLHDIAQRAGSTGATTHQLHREAIGHFDCSQAVSLDDITAETLAALVHPVEEMIRSKKR